MMVLCRYRNHLYVMLLHQLLNVRLEFGTVVYVKLLRVLQRSLLVDVLEHLCDLAGFLRLQRSARLVPRGYVFHIQGVLVRVLVDLVMQQVQEVSFVHLVDLRHVEMRVIDALRRWYVNLP